MRIFVAVFICFAMSAVPAVATMNSDEDLGFLSGFWKDWVLTVRLDNCGAAMGRYACQYRIMNEDGLQADFGSEGDGSAVTNFLIMKRNNESELLFLVATATAIKAIAEDMSQEDREALSKALYKEATAKGTAERKGDGWQIKMTKVSATAWVAEGQISQ